MTNFIARINDSYPKWREWCEKYPTLLQLSKNRIFSVHLQNDFNISLQEECDENFEVSLSSDEIRSLAKELWEVAEENDRRKGI